jgi:hypothetical protein
MGKTIGLLLIEKSDRKQPGRGKEKRRQKKESGIFLFSLFHLLSYFWFPTNPIASNREGGKKKEDRRKNPEFFCFLSSIFSLISGFQPIRSQATGNQV